MLLSSGRTSFPGSPAGARRAPSRPRLLATAATACSVVALAAGAAAPAQAATTERVSVSSTGHQANRASTLGAMSPDGRYVVFTSEATNLVKGDTNEKADAFIRDRRKGTTERVSLSSKGAQGDGDSSAVGVSADGRYVAFQSLATNLVAGDANGRTDVFVRDRQSGRTVRATVTSGGAEAAEGGNIGMITADGRYVLFASAGAKLVPGDTNHATDVFLRDLRAGTTERASLSTGNGQGDGYSSPDGFSGQGRYVEFDSQATNLVKGDTNGLSDVFVRDRQARTTTRASVSSDGVQGDADSYGAGLSADGRYAVFWSAATNLAAGDGDGFSDVFVHDLAAGRTERVSAGRGGAPADGDSYACCVRVISADGRYVAFESKATNLAEQRPAAETNVYVADRRKGVTTLESVSSAGAPGDIGGHGPEISADGRVVAFTSDSTNLVPGDTNGRSDVFVRLR